MDERNRSLDEEGVTDSAESVTGPGGSEGGSEGESRGRLGESIRKLFAVGTAAAFLTEEGLRQSLGDLKLPKEVLNLVLSGANRSKEELLNRVGNELVKLVSKIDMVKEASRFMETHKFKISAEVEVLRKDLDSKS